MKRIIHIFILISVSTSISAQLISSLGIKAGSSISNQEWNYTQDDNSDYDNMQGLSLRIFADMFKFSFFEMETELGYSSKGFEVNMPVTTVESPMGTGETISFTNELDYISLSALAKFTHSMEIFSPYLIIGPQFNLLINKNPDTGWDVVFDKFRETNIGISAGGGIELGKLLPSPVFIEYRYERDLQDNYEPDNITIKNYSHVVLIGIRL